MVFTVAMRDGDARRWSRRSVLGAAALAGTAATASGCTWLGSPEPEPPPPDPLEPLLADTRALVARYERARAAHPDLTDALAPLRDAHAAHVAALRELIGLPDPATPSPGATPPPSPTPTAAAAGDIADDPDEAVGDLREAEAEAFEDVMERCLAAPPERTALLGSICAARATHLEVLS
jgi:hypothetical protein